MRIEEEREKQVGLKKGDTILCSKTDGKGWHCKREAKEGNSLCEHHLTQLQNYNNLAHPSPKKLSENRRRARPKKPSSSSNPNEFYYYSGFGPLWGKKRCPGRTEKADQLNRCSSSSNGGIMSKVVEPIEPVIEVHTATHSSSFRIDNDEFDYVEDDDEEEENGDKPGKKRVRKPIKARSLKSLM
ncbi:unnamed protein product [Ilex paraguariensis]